VVHASLDLANFMMFTPMKRNRDRLFCVRDEEGTGAETER
jgi:hypothetical protein